MPIIITILTALGEGVVVLLSFLRSFWVVLKMAVPMLARIGGNLANMAALLRNLWGQLYSRPLIRSLLNASMFVGVYAVMNRGIAQYAYNHWFCSIPANQSPGSVDMLTPIGNFIGMLNVVLDLQTVYDALTASVALVVQVNIYRLSMWLYARWLKHMSLITRMGTPTYAK